MGNLTTKIKERVMDYVMVSLLLVPLVHSTSTYMDRHKFEQDKNLIKKSEIHGVTAYGFDDDNDSKIDRIECAGLYGLVAGRMVGTIGIRHTHHETDGNFDRLKKRFENPLF